MGMYVANYGMLMQVESIIIQLVEVTIYPIETLSYTKYTQLRSTKYQIDGKKRCAFRNTGGLIHL